MIDEQPARRYFCNVSVSLSEAALIKVLISSIGMIVEVNFRSLLDGPRNRSRKR